jgi:aarF domain-containing kinase
LKSSLLQRPLIPVRKRVHLREVSQNISEEHGDDWRENKIQENKNWSFVNSASFLRRIRTSGRGWIAVLISLGIRALVVYTILFHLFVEFYHQYLNDPYAAFFPFVDKYLTPIFQTMEGAIRMLRTTYYCVLVGIDYKFHMLAFGERWEKDPEFRKRVHQRSAQRFLELFKKNGCVYIKVGQYMASMKHILPDEYIETLYVLQDQAPFVSYEEIEKVIFQEFGKKPDELFDYFDKRPLAAASLAQVHRAIMKGSGREVAVKVQYPRTRYFFEGDMLTHKLVVWGLNIFFPNYNFEFLRDEMAKYLRTELDFRLEAKNGKRAAYNFRHRKDVHIPEIIDELSSEKVLTAEFIHAVKINDVEGMKRLGISKKKAAQILFEAMADQIYKHGFVHTDPHPGNVFIRKDKNGSEQLVILDHGLYKELDERFRENYCRLYKALVLRDEVNIKRYCNALGIEDWKLFSTLILMRSYDGAIVGMGNGVKESERRAFLERMRTQMDQMLDVLRMLPKEMLMILRNNNLLRAINHELGVPVNRFSIFARTAAAGIHIDKPLYQENEKRGFMQSINSSFMLLLSWREKLLFECYLSIYRFLHYCIDNWNRIQILLGFADEFNEDKVLDAG